MNTVLKIDMEPLKVMATANKYTLAINDSLARSLTFQSDWALLGQPHQVRGHAAGGLRALHPGGARPLARHVQGQSLT